MTCKGCYALGTACGDCEKCLAERVSIGHEQCMTATPTHEEALRFYRERYRRFTPSYTLPRTEWKAQWVADDSLHLLPHYEVDGWRVFSVTWAKTALGVGAFCAVLRREPTAVQEIDAGNDPSGKETK
jgi:hypothetical protein